MMGAKSKRNTDTSRKWADIVKWAVESNGHTVEAIEVIDSGSTILVKIKNPEVLHVKQLKE